VLSPRQREISELIEPVVKALGCVLWGVEFSSYNQHSILRIYIDSEDGVKLADCEKISRQISGLLDVEDTIPGRYTLEVSSPGIYRPLYHLTQYSPYVGERVKIKLNRSFEGRKKISGILTNVDMEEGELILQIKDEQLTIPVEWVEKAQLEPEF
jgi:ribosome maturation factor RimP